jgi:phage terminase small subunit
MSDPTTQPAPLSPQQRYDSALASLRPKQRKFVLEYLDCLNAAEAARRAKYAERSARQVGRENLTKPDIAEAVRLGMSLQAMPAEEILARLAQHARGSLEPFLRVNARGEFTGFDLDASQPLHLLRRVTRTTRAYKDGSTETSVQIEIHDPQAALRDLARAGGLFVERTQQEPVPDIDWDRVPEDVQIAFLERRIGLAQVVAAQERA